MSKPERHAPSEFQKLYDSLSLADRLSIDSTVQMSFLLFQKMHEMVIIQQNQNRKEQ